MAEAQPNAQDRTQALLTTEIIWRGDTIVYNRIVFAPARLFRHVAAAYNGEQTAAAAVAAATFATAAASNVNADANNQGAVALQPADMFYRFAQNLIPLLANVNNGERQSLSINRRRHAAAESTGTVGRGKMVEIYLDLSTKHSNDRQNSHDVSVNASKGANITRLRAEQSDGQLVSIKSIMTEIKNPDFTRGPDGKKSLLLKYKAKQVAELMNSKREYSKSADATDYETLIRVWTRANDPLNADNAAKIRQAVFDVLADSWEKHPLTGKMGIQCVDGRIARLLGALVLLDHDPQNWSFNKLEDLKNEVFTLARVTIHKCALEAAEDSNPLVAAVGKTFLATRVEDIELIGELDRETDEKWLAKTKKRVQNVFESRIKEINVALSDAVPSRVKNAIIEEALGAL